MTQKSLPERNGKSDLSSIDDEQQRACQEPPPTPLPPVKPKRKSRRLPKKKIRPKGEPGWFRQTMACLGICLIAACGTLLLWDFKIAPFQLQLPTFWMTGGKPGELIVLVDAGHGGHDSGATASGMVEKDLNLEVAKEVKADLVRRGIRAELTRDSDLFLPLGERTALANRLQNCVFVSIHFNHAKDKTAEGVETYYSSEKVYSRRGDGWMRSILDLFTRREIPREDDSRVLAESIQAALIESTGAPDRGVKDQRLFVVRRTPHTAALVEGGFLSNSVEAKKLDAEDYRLQLARAVAEGIQDYLSVSQRLQTKK